MSFWNCVRKSELNRLESENMYKSYLLKCDELITGIWHRREYYFDTEEEMVDFAKKESGSSFKVEAAFKLDKLDNNIFA